MNCMAVGVDIAKNVFQVHYVAQDTGEIVNKPIRRAKFLEHFANRAPCLIGMEACVPPPYTGASGHIPFGSSLSAPLAC